jgi:hypothetical protein
MGLDGVRAASWELHARAEGAGIIADILAGRASRYGVALLLRNLLPVYQVLDASAFGVPALARSGAITMDLHLLAPDKDLPLLAAGAAYADRVRQAGAGLVGHAYVRYLGDLNGGRVLRRRMADCLGDVGRALSFHDYPALGDLDRFTRDYREGLDRVVRAVGCETVLREVLVGFELNIALAEAVRAAG